MWSVGEIALLKLPNKAKAFWPLVRVLETFPDKDQVVRSVKVLKPAQNEVVVNVKHLIVLELYFELNNPQIYSDNTDESTQRESDSEMEEVMSEVDGSVGYLGLLLLDLLVELSKLQGRRRRVLHVGDLCKFVYNVDVIV